MKLSEIAGKHEDSPEEIDALLRELENPSPPPPPDPVQDVLQDPRFRDEIALLRGGIRLRYEEHEKTCDLVIRVCNIATAAMARIRKLESALHMAGQNQLELSEVVAKLQGRLSRLESSESERYHRFAIPREN